MPSNKKLFSIHHKDARLLKDIISEEIIDVTITSPPYFDVKDYGVKNQIGFGQSYEEYLEDLKIVFCQIFKATKESGSLWVIIDTVNRDGEVIPLPFDFASKIKECGWKFREIIIWEKDKTVPWTHKGQMRNSFEYVLLFSKTDNFNFFIDRIRNYESLKKWWVKYPERYNPKGKTPEAVWHFPIPVQGTWGDGYIRHFCPLPEEMVARILTLSTSEGDVVFDPFSGSGAVLAKAHSMGRKYIGTELNKKYIGMFKEYLENKYSEKSTEYKQAKIYLSDQNKFERLVLELRVLKFGRILIQKTKEQFKGAISGVFIDIADIPPSKKNSLIVANYNFLLTDSKSKDVEQIYSFLNVLISKLPLSKFGIEAVFNLETREFLSHNENFYAYTTKNTNKFTRKVTRKDIFSLSTTECIISPICVDVDEKDYE